MPTAFIIGGTGQIGIAVAAELLRAGWKVTASHTGRRDPQNVPRGTNLVVLDRRDTAALDAVIGTPDLLVDTMAFTGADADQLIEIAGRFGQLAVISTASVYEDAAGRSLETAGAQGFPEYGGPIAETARTVRPGPGYSAGKVELERRLLDACPVPVAILRPCAIHGVNARHPREWWFVKRMLDGRERIPLAFGDGVFHTTAAANIAALVRAAVERPATRILNAGDPTPPSVREIGETFASALAWSGRLVDVAPDAGIGHTPFSVPAPLIVAMEAAGAIGYRPVGGYAETVAPYLEWMKAHAADWRVAFTMFRNYPADPFDYAAEDAAFAAS